jgi:hypothetical protein
VFYGLTAGEVHDEGQFLARLRALPRADLRGGCDVVGHRPDLPDRRLLDRLQGVGKMVQFVGYDFGTGVVIGSSCAINPDGGFAASFALRSYDVYGNCDMECPSDTISPGNMVGERESASQGMYYTSCNTMGP